MAHFVWLYWLVFQLLLKLVPLCVCSVADFRQNSIMMFWKFMMDQIYYLHFWDLTMAHRSPNSCLAVAISYIFSSQLTTVVLTMASRFTMKVSNSELYDLISLILVINRCTGIIFGKFVWFPKLKKI